MGRDTPREAEERWHRWRRRWAGRRVNGHQAAEAAVKEQEVDEVLLSADGDAVLVADERAGAAHLGQEAAQVVHQAALQLAFGVRLGQVQEVEGVVVLHSQRGLSPDLRR